MPGGSPNASKKHIRIFFSRGWQTASEQNNAGYHIQRSANARLGFVSGAGNTSEKREYTYTDVSPLSGLNYYRLRQTDLDGRTEYSPIVIADAGFSAHSFTLFPNPAPGGITALFLPETKDAAGTLEVFDWMGGKVFHQQIEVGTGEKLLLPLDLSNYPTGMYHVRLELGEEIKTERLVITR